MTDLKRDEIKYIRDISKNAYKKDNSCFICTIDNTLEFHHYYSMTALWEKWKKEHNVAIDCVDDILKYRLVFKEDHYNEIYNETVTLCKEHHQGLHKVYGKVPKLITAEKQKRWVVKKRDKLTEKLKDDNPK